MKNLRIVPNNNNLIPLHHRSSFNKSEYSEVIDNWLNRSRSHHTRRIYKADIADFFREMAQTEEPAGVLAEFFSLPSYTAYDIVSQFHTRLIARGLAPATINRKLAALTSLVNYANKIGKCNFSLNKIDREKVTTYRDTTGIDKNSFKEILTTCDLDSIQGIRDRAILVLLWSNALRRSELAGTNIGDFDCHNKTLRIIGKGKAGQYEYISLGQNTVAAICAWLEVRGENDPNKPLFTSIRRGYWGRRLSTTSIYKMVKKRSSYAGVKVISPHKIRHSSITAALDATDGDVRRVQKLSRHANINTLLKYDDNRKNLQAEVTELLDDLL